MQDGQTVKGRVRPGQGDTLRALPAFAASLRAGP